jgi:HrpA-like RNA helicase
MEQYSLFQALTELHVLRALDDEGHVTEEGRLMSAFPVEPSVARMLVTAARRYFLICSMCLSIRKKSVSRNLHSATQCFGEMAAIAAMLSTESIWVHMSRREQMKRQDSRVEEVERNQRSLFHMTGDLLTYLHIFHSFAELGDQGSKKSLRDTSRGGREDQRRWGHEFGLSSRALTQAARIRCHVIIMQRVTEIDE